MPPELPSARPRCLARRTRAAVGLAALGLSLTPLVAAAEPPPPAPGPSPSPAGSDCARNLPGDLQTATDRNDKGRPAEALEYLLGLAACPDTLSEPDWYLQRARAHEALSELNLAWLAGRGAEREAAARGDGRVAAQVIRWQAAFLARVARLRVEPDSPKPPRLRYAGPMLDGPTARLLDDVALGRPVSLPGGGAGYFLLPGSYEIDGQKLVLDAGQEVAVPPPGAPG